MTVNDGLKYFEGKADYDYCLVTTIKLQDVHNHNLPTDDEAEVLNEMEDVILNELTKVTSPLEIGRETYFGEREILIYFPKISDFKATIDNISNKLNVFRFTSLELHHDPQWKLAKRYLGFEQNA